MKFCPVCGVQHQDAASFCSRCGTALPAPPRSPETDGDEGGQRDPETLPPRPAPRQGAAPGPGYAPHEAPYPPQGSAYPPAGGYPQPGGAYPPQDYGRPGPDMRGLDSGEQIGVFLGSLCVSPIVALVLYFVWREDKPRKAQEVCTLGWWVVGTWVVLYGLFFLLAILTS